MEIQYNSINARLYRWFYNVSNMPQSICPYFWKLLWVYLAIIPMVLVTLPMQIYYKFAKQNNSERLRDGVISYIIFMIIFCMISVFSLLFGYTPIKNTLIYHVLCLGIALWYCALLMGVVIGAIKLYDIKKRTYYYDHDDYYYRRYYYDNNNNKIYAEPKYWLLIAFIKAKYNRHCTKIIWKYGRERK